MSNQYWLSTTAKLPADWVYLVFVLVVLESIYFRLGLVRSLPGTILGPLFGPLGATLGGVLGAF